MVFSEYKVKENILIINSHCQINQALKMKTGCIQIMIIIYVISFFTVPVRKFKLDVYA
jgi:hypothetical protein